MAITTDLAKQAGVDYTEGEAFPKDQGGDRYHTAKLKGNPMDTAIKIIDKAGEVKKLYREDANFSYRTSRFQSSGEIILSSKLELQKISKEEIDTKVRDILVRKTHQPAGPSVGSTFRNPEGEHSGALLDQCGLKGTILGGAKISDQHANFIINTGNAKASNVKALIDLMKKAVKEKFNIDLVEEVRYLGDW